MAAGERLALFVVTAILVSLVGARVAASLSGSSEAAERGDGGSETALANGGQAGTDGDREPGIGTDGAADAATDAIPERRDQELADGGADANADPNGDDRDR